MLKEYICGVLGFVTVASVMIALSHTRLKKSVSLGVGVLMICAIMLPLVDIFRGISINDRIDSMLENIQIEGGTDDMIEAAFEKGICAYIAEEYRVSEGSVNVMCDGFDLGSLKAERIYVTLSGESVRIDNKRLEADIEERFVSGGKCEVSYSLD